MAQYMRSTAAQLFGNALLEEVQAVVVRERVGQFRDMGSVGQSSRNDREAPMR
jgi:hypothetical protein